MRGWQAAVMAAAMVFGPVWASQAEGVPGRTTQVRGSLSEAAYVALVEAQVRSADALFAGSCPSLSLEPMGVEPYRPREPGALDPLLTQAREEGRSMFVERYRVRGCGADRVHNALVFAGRGVASEVVRGLPGTGLASPGLQRVARDAVTAAIRTRLQARNPRQPACRLRLLDVAVSTPPAEDDMNAAWVERWSLEACGQAVRAQVTYAATADGGFGVAVPESALTFDSAGPME